MKVLELINSFHQGGSERQAIQLTRLLREDGKFEVFLACLNNEGVLRNEVEKLGFTNIPEYKLTSFLNAQFFRQARTCARSLLENKIQIIHTHDFYTNIFGMVAASISGVKVKIASKRETGGMRSKGQKVAEKLAFGRANAIVANAEAVKKHLVIEGIPERKINVIYNGLDLERLTPKTTNRTQICKTLGLPNDKNAKFISLVANLRHEVKNQPMFLRAAQKVLQKFPNAHFVLAGEGELKEGLENLANDLQISANTHFIGRCTIVPELLSISYTGVLTSFNEGFSNSILEYMAAGKSVVATNVGGASEAIVENESGFLIESNNEVTLAEKLIWLLENPDKNTEFGKKGREIVEQKFSCEAQLKNTIELYKNQLNGK
ncbi:MAG: glycosyltransferase [Pyrinomonadaceae bacterium]|nr:glycosyltransferase [Pyrinomonadaceae bacterium]